MIYFRKRSLGSLGAAALFLAVFAPAAGAALEKNRYGEAVELGEPLTNVSIQHCVAGVENGEPTVYYTAAGDPALFHVVSINENRLEATYELPNAARSWNHLIAPDGTVYIAGVAIRGSAHFYRYLPEEKRVEDLGPGVRGHKFIWALAAAEDGKIYGGTWEGGHVFEFDPETGKTRDLGRVDPTEDYVRSIAWHGGFVYAGTGTRNGRVWRIDPKSGEKERIELPMRDEYADQFESIRSIYHLAVAGDHLFLFLNEPRLLLAYDLKKEEWWDWSFPFQSGPVTGAYLEEENAFYHPGPEDVLWKTDLGTRKQEKVMRYRGGFRGGNFVEVDGFSGKTLATVFGSGAIGLYNPGGPASRSLSSNAKGQGTGLQAMETGPGGKIYLSGYMGVSGAAFDPKTGETEVFRVGQAEGIIEFGDSLFWGVYPRARIYEQKPLSKNLDPKLLFEIEHKQDRPFAMATDNENIYIGTIPDYGELEGALTVLTPDSEGGMKRKVFENVVSDQSIVSLARLEGTGLLFGSTSIYGGLGIDAKETRAKLFVWDVKKEEKIEEFDLELPGLNTPRMIGGLSVGPDRLIWGAVHGFIFAFDPETLEIVKQKNLYPDVTRYGRWRQVQLRWAKDGLLYTNPGGRITVVDPATLEHLDLKERSGLLTIGGDGNLYFANGSRFRMIPVGKKTDLN